MEIFFRGGIWKKGRNERHPLLTWLGRRTWTPSGKRRGLEECPSGKRTRMWIRKEGLPFEIHALGTKIFWTDTGIFLVSGSGRGRGVVSEISGRRTNAPSFFPSGCQRVRSVECRTQFGRRGHGSCTRIPLGWTRGMESFSWGTATKPVLKAPGLLLLRFPTGCSDYRK